MAKVRNTLFLRRAYFPTHSVCAIPCILNGEYLSDDDDDYDNNNDNGKDNQEKYNDNKVDNNKYNHDKVDQPSHLIFNGFFFFIIRFFGYHCCYTRNLRGWYSPA